MKNQIKQKGFTILETIVVLMVMVAAISAGSVYLKRNADNNLNQAAAANLQRLTQATKWYAKDNYTTLKSAGESSLSVTDLIDKKYLEAGFPKTNSYGQGYRIAIRPDGTDSELLQLQIITENGAMITPENMKKIAGIAGSDAGYALTANTITGNQSGWQLSGQNIAMGHLASVSYISGKDIVSAENFLRRDKFDGHPEWNQMNTNLDMQSNTLVFNDDNMTATLNAENGLAVEGNGGNTSVQAGDIEVSSAKVQGASSYRQTSVSGKGITPPIYSINANSIQDVYTFSDDQCDGLTGKKFILSALESTFHFTCGIDDGFKLGKGRAYLERSDGKKILPHLENLKECKFWNPQRDMGVDSCIEKLTSDYRSVIIKRTQFRKRTGFKDGIWHNGDCGNTKKGTSAEGASICQVTSSGPVNLLDTDSTTLKAMMTPDEKCTSYYLGAESTEGDSVPNIYVANEDDDLYFAQEGLGANERCPNLKYHTE